MSENIRSIYPCVILPSLWPKREKQLGRKELLPLWQSFGEFLVRSSQDQSWTSWCLSLRLVLILCSWSCVCEAGALFHEAGATSLQLVLHLYSCCCISEAGVASFQPVMHLYRQCCISAVRYVVRYAAVRYAAPAAEAALTAEMQHCL